MGRLSAEGTDAVLLGKLKILLRKAIEDPTCSTSSPERRRKVSSSSSYETFVQSLDPDDPLAAKCVEVLARDTLSRARRRRLALNAARPIHAMEHDRPFSRAWNVNNASGILSNLGTGEDELRIWRQQQETAEYDAIIADAQRRVASPLPALGTTSRMDNSPWRETPSSSYTSYLNSSEWPNLNSGAGQEEYGERHRAYDTAHHWNDGYSSPDDSEGSDELDAHRRTLEAERALSRVRRQRDEREEGGAGSSRDEGGGSTSATRFRIIERLEQRRRIREETAERLREIRDRRGLPHSLPQAEDESDVSTSLPIIVGGDFSQLPDSVTTSSSNTVRATYAPQQTDLHRNNSIRRSGFHTALAAGSSSSTPPRNDALPISLPRTTASPLGSSSANNADNDATSSSAISAQQQRMIPRSPLTVPDIHLPPSASSSLTPAQDSARATLRRLSALSERRAASSSSVGLAPPQPLMPPVPPVIEGSSTSREQRIESFQDFARQSRQASRVARGAEGGQEPEERRRTAVTASSERVLRLVYPGEVNGAHEGDLPMHNNDNIELDQTAEEISEMLGSSSTAAALGNLASTSSSSTVGPRHIYPIPRRQTRQMSSPGVAAPPPNAVHEQEEPQQSLGFTEDEVQEILRRHQEHSDSLHGLSQQPPIIHDSDESAATANLEDQNSQLVGTQELPAPSGEQPGGAEEAISLSEFLHTW